jgi:ComF family protein
MAAAPLLEFQQHRIPPLMVNPRFIRPPGRDRPSSLMSRVADGVLNLFYPESCVICSVPVSRVQNRGVCPDCQQKILLQRITGPMCPSCGVPFQSLETESTHLCGPCILQLPPYAGARAFGRYSSELSRIIQAFKFDGRRNLAGLLAPLLAETLQESWSLQEIDLIVPVPLHPKRKRARGYNQALLLARDLAGLVGLPYRHDALRRVRHTLPQVGLSDAERARNLRRAFLCKKPAVVKGLHVLLVDDVMTTGSTAASAAEALLEGGALRVSVLTLARAVAGQE